MLDSIIRARIGSAPQWPVVLYYHHIHPSLKHYTSLTEYYFEKSIETSLANIGFHLDPNSITDLDSLKRKSKPEFLITFDDGYRDNIEYALPILDKYKIKAIFFILPSFIQEVPKIINDPWKDYMTWSDLRFLENQGHVIGAHTMSHCKLNQLPRKYVEYEIKNSIKLIEEKLKKSTVHFAYPYGLLPNYPIKFRKRTLSFGTVKAHAVPWDRQRFNIRRTYYPTNDTSSWTKLAKGWREQWFKFQ